MNLRRINLLSILLLISNLLFAAESGASIIIPFSYPEKSYLPVFSVTDEDGRTLNLLFDSGYNYCALFPSALEKIENGQTLLGESTKEYLKSIYPDKSEHWLKNTAKKIINTNQMTLTFKGLKCNDFYSESQVFIYTPNDISKNIADGIVGIDFFHSRNNLTIDYINNLIIIDGSRVNGTSLNMKKEEIGLYSISIFINDISQTAIIDTGAQKSILRHDFDIPDSELSESEKTAFIYKRNDCKDLKGNIGYTNAVIRADNISKSVRAYKSGNMLTKASVYGKRVTYVYNILGYDFYSDSCIQFDFENNYFRICEGSDEFFD